MSRSLPGGHEIGRQSSALSWSDAAAPAVSVPSGHGTHRPVPAAALNVPRLQTSHVRVAAFAARPGGQDNGTGLQLG